MHLETDSNMTVLQNIEAGAKREKDSVKRKAMIGRIIESFGLVNLTRHYPRQLSGGQQQRTALARILVSDPGILLLDEPFSALDSHLRFQLEQEVQEVMKRFGKTVILVSHDRDEVFRLSSRIAVMNSGHVETFGTKSDVFARPGTSCAAALTGCKNISRALPLDDTHLRANDWGIDLETVPGALRADGVGIRMHEICAGEGANSFSCKVVGEIENPFSYTVVLAPGGAQDGSPLLWDLSKEQWKTLRADKITVSLPPQSIILLKG